MSIRPVLCLAGLLALPPDTGAEDKPLRPDLAKVNDMKFWRILNGTAEMVKNGNRSAVRLKPAAEADTPSNVALALVEGLEFSTGAIEVELKGRDKKQNSFLGVAFAAADGKAFEAVYFRPFNFKAEGAFGKRAVQYISWPTHTWEKLRADSPGKFENAAPVPDPNGWFKARVEVGEKQVRAFVGDSKEPSLVVDRLPGTGKGRVGLWVDVVDGMFANLTITPAR